MHMDEVYCMNKLLQKIHFFFTFAHICFSLRRPCLNVLRATSLKEISKYRRNKTVSNIYFGNFAFLYFLHTCIISLIIRAPSSEFVSSSIPSWQILTAHAQSFRGARDLAFCLKVPLDSLLVWASSEGSGETARMRRLAWTFAARIGDKYQIRLTRSITMLICWKLIFFIPTARTSIFILYVSHMSRLMTKPTKWS